MQPVNSPPTTRSSRHQTCICELDDAMRDLLKHAMTECNLNARADDRILMMARTIAGFAAAENIFRNQNR